jgi:hypothetical protein
MLPTDYDWWAKNRAHYETAKSDVSEAVLTRLERCLPGIRDAVRMTDVATPLTYWTMARSWRGAYEGWMPSASSFFGHVSKTLTGLGRFYMAGQWVEPAAGCRQPSRVGVKPYSCSAGMTIVLSSPHRHPPPSPRFPGAPSRAGPSSRCATVCTRSQVGLVCSSEYVLAGSLHALIFGGLDMRTRVPTSMTGSSSPLDLRERFVADLD